jgi:hypothetical protein
VSGAWAAQPLSPRDHRTLLSQTAPGGWWRAAHFTAYAANSRALCAEPGRERAAHSTAPALLVTSVVTRCRGAGTQ